MIIDAFTFFNELDIAVCRFEYLYDYVDKFVVVESNITHSGKPKRMLFKDNFSLFEKYKDKIVYCPYYFDNTIHNLNFNNKDFVIETSDVWKVEHMQRNHITYAVKDMPSDAMIMVSDVDEIPNRHALQYVKSMLDSNAVTYGSFKQDIFNYDLRHLKNLPWFGTVVSKLEFVQKHGAQWLRKLEWDITSHRFHNCGWHLSYFGDVDRIINKIQSFAHQEYNTEYFKDPARIKHAIKNDIQLFEIIGEKYIIVDKTHFPADFWEIFKQFERITVSE